MWAEKASDPFGRVKRTAQSFARNGNVAVASKWTLPKPPSRLLFQSPPGFHSRSPDEGPLFGPSTQSRTLFGSCGSNSSGNEAPQNVGGFAFGYATLSTKTDAAFGTASTDFGGGAGQGNTTPLFGSVSVDSGFGATRTLFSKAGSSLEASKMGIGSGGSCTVFKAGSSAAKPPLAPTLNPFATPTKKQTGKSFGNPFAPLSVSTSNPSALTPQSSGGSPFSRKVAANATVNPFAVKVSAKTTVNPFAMKATSKVWVDPYCCENTFGGIQDVPSAVPGRAASVKFRSGLRPDFNTAVNPWRSCFQQHQLLAPTESS